MPRLYRMKVSTEAEIDMVVVADSEDEARKIAKACAKREAHDNLCMDLWEEASAYVEDEIRSEGDLPPDWELDSTPWGPGNRPFERDVGELLADLPPPEDTPTARARMAMKERLRKAKEASAKRRALEGLDEESR